ncbi:MAG: methyltransferase domain-containing protein [Singulisphaera sp.]
MDAAGLAEDEVSDAYRVLRRVNRQLGNQHTMERELRRHLDEEPRGGETVTILDVGSGSGDIVGALQERLEARRVRVSAVALDRDSIAVKLARGRGIRAVRGDALRLPFADRSVDGVTAVKFAHHFEGDPLRRLVAEMARVARRRVVVLDIRRHWVAYWGFVAWSRLFTRNRLVRFDGPLSVLRGFTVSELAELSRSIPRFLWTVRTYPGFQLALVGRRTS